MEDLKTLLEKMKEDENSFDIAVAKLKRKADKGLLDGVSSEDINKALGEISSTTDIEKPETEDLEFMKLIKESQDAVNYYYKEISPISETIKEIDNLNVCQYLDESNGISFDPDSTAEVKVILEKLEWENIAELIEYYSYINSNKMALIENTIVSDIEGLIEDAGDIDDEDVLLEAGEALKAGWNTFKQGVKQVGQNFVSDTKAPLAAVSGMSTGISNAFKTVGSAALAHPLGALAIGGLYAGGALIRKLIRKAVAKRQAKKAEKEAQGLAESTDIETKLTIEDYLR